jgi:hypothetical protein
MELAEMGFTGASVTPIHGLKEKIEEKRRAAELAEMRASFEADDDDDCDGWELEDRRGYLD